MQYTPYLNIKQESWCALVHKVIEAAGRLAKTTLVEKLTITKL
jgi:hypothetical protein